MKWTRIETTPIGMNTYILENEKKECIIVDVGGSPQKIIEVIENKGLNPIAILLTHAHFDHIEGIDAVYQSYALPVYLCEKEKEWLTDGRVNGSELFFSKTIGAFAPTDIRFLKEGEMQLGEFQFEVRFTPGHSPGSVSFYFAKEKVVITGDALFQGSIGRTDLAYGDYQQLIRSIQTKLLSLSNEVVVLPGHGGSSTIGFERKGNPFLN